jgi:hypothetical protein
MTINPAQLTGLVVSCLALSLGFWLALFPANYLRAGVKYAAIRSWLTAEKAESPWYQLAFRLVGCGLLAFTAVYLYAAFHAPH